MARGASGAIIGSRSLVEGIFKTPSEDRVEFVERDLVEVQIMEKIRRKGLQLLRGLHQPLEDGVGIELEQARRAPDAQPFGQTRHDAHDELGRGALAMEHGAVRLREIPVAGDTLQLAPGLATGMAVGANIAPPEPAVIRAIVLGTELPRGVDGAPASPREDDHRRWRARGFGTSIEPLLTGLTQGFVDISGEGFGFCGPLAPGCGRLERHLGCGTSRVRAPDMNEQTDQHESDNEKLIKQGRVELTCG